MKILRHMWRRDERGNPTLWSSRQLGDELYEKLSSCAHLVRYRSEKERSKLGSEWAARLLRELSKKGCVTIGGYIEGKRLFRVTHSAQLVLERLGETK